MVEKENHDKENKGKVEHRNGIEDIKYNSLRNNNVINDKEPVEKTIDFYKLNSTVAKVELGAVNFLLKIDHNETFLSFKRKLIARIGRFAFPEKKVNEKNIDLDEYKDFKFVIRHGESLYLLENDQDLEAGMILKDNILDVVVKKEEDGDISFFTNS